MSRRVVTCLLSCVLLSACKKDEPVPAPVKSAPQSAAPAPSAALPNTAPAADSKGVVRIDAKARAEDELGYSVAASGDRIAISAFKRQASDQDEHPGSVLLFRLEAGRAVLETELVADKSHQLGNAIAFDGNTLVAGAMYDQGAKPETGAAYVFSRGSEGWSKAQKLSSRQSNADDSFGIGVAIVDQSVVIADSRESGGSLFAFEAQKQAFAPKQTLPFPDPSGPAETLAAHGRWLAVGAQFSGEIEEQGRVRVYERGDKGLSEIAVLTEPKPGKEQHFGGAVAVGPGTIAAASEKALTLFEHRGGRFQPSAELTPPIATGLADAALAVGQDVLAIGLPIPKANPTTGSATRSRSDRST
jgi:hypothetical protein